MRKIKARDINRVESESAYRYHFRFFSAFMNTYDTTFFLFLNTFLVWNAVYYLRNEMKAKTMWGNKISNAELPQLANTYMNELFL